MPSGDEIRDVQKATWAGLSAGWEKWDSVIMDQLGPIGVGAAPTAACTGFADLIRGRRGCCSAHRSGGARRR